MIDWIYPQTVEKTHSDFNGEVKVLKSCGKYSVWVNGFQQSGPLVEKIWQDALKEVVLRTQPHLLGNVLVLGFGCGAIVKYLPNCHITGIEIDPVMVYLGKKYFGLKTVKVIISDAQSYINRTKRKFDLVVVDVYKGGKQKKLVGIEKVLKTKGKIITNELTFERWEYKNVIK